MQIRQLLSLKVHGERFLVEQMIENVGQIQVRSQVLGMVCLFSEDKQCIEIDWSKGSNIFLDHLGPQYTEFWWVFSIVRLQNQLFRMHYSDCSRVTRTCIYLSLGREEIHLLLTRKNTLLSLLSKPEQGKMVFYFMGVGHRQKASNSFLLWLSNVLPSPLEQLRDIPRRL